MENAERKEDKVIGLAEVLLFTGVSESELLLAFSQGKVELSQFDSASARGEKFGVKLSELAKLTNLPLKELSLLSSLENSNILKEEIAAAIARKIDSFFEEAYDLATSWE